MVTISICIGSACHLKGSYDIIKELQEMIRSENLQHLVELKGAFCLGNCTRSVSVAVNDGEVMSVDRYRVREFFDNQVRSRL